MTWFEKFSITFELPQKRFFFQNPSFHRLETQNKNYADALNIYGAPKLRTVM